MKIGEGDRLYYGAISVVPNGGATPPTVGTAEQAGIVRTLLWTPGAVAPNQFTDATSNTSLTGSWTLTFMNGDDTLVVSTPTTTDTAPPFVKNVKISGSGANPTFTWTIPDDFTPDTIQINVFDKAKSVDFAYGVHSVSLDASATSYQMPTVLSSGLELDPANPDGYVFEIGLIVKRDPAGSNSIANRLSRSRSFFDFAVLGPDDPPDVYLPTATSAGAYTFRIDVTANELIYIDPPVATGYQYQVGAGDPNFASVILPAVGDNRFTVVFQGDSGTVVEDVEAGEELPFPIGGVDAFTVLGIEPAAALDPNNATAFVTGLTFVSSGQFTGSMTPITTVDGPSPAAIDIKPGSARNFVNSGSNGKVPVALLGSASLDVSALSGVSATFGSGAAQNAHDLSVPLTLSQHISDVNGDGIADLTFHFVQSETGLGAGDTAACMTVQSDQGVFAGCGEVEVK